MTIARNKLGSVVSKMYFRADDLENAGKIEAAEELRRFADELQELPDET